MRRVTFSRNYTISLSRSCASYCKYCAFATHQPHLREPQEVERLLDEAVKRRSKELLVLTGEQPDSLPTVMRRLNELGFSDFVAYVVWTCERALERGLLPHTNIGAATRNDLARLRDVTASQGLMLETISERLMQTVHAGSPSKHPAARVATIGAAGELKIPFTSGLLLGIGETEDERMAGLEELARLHQHHGHLQEVILQNFVPHPRYHRQDVGEIADQAARTLWGDLAHSGLGPGGRALSEHEAKAAGLPDWASPVSAGDVARLVAESRRLMPDVGVQIPPNLAEWWPQLLEAGVTDLGGLSANGDHISPEHPFPSPKQVRARLAGEGIALSERLCVYPQYINDRWLAPAVLDAVRTNFWSFIPRVTDAAPVKSTGHALADPGLVREAIARARGGERLGTRELTSLFRERRDELVEEIREAADAVRRRAAGETVTYVVNRNINFTNICTVGCAFCGFGQSRRSPDAHTISADAFVAKVEQAVSYGATELCLQGGIHPDYRLDDYLYWLRLAKEVAPSLHLHAFSPMEIDHMCAVESATPGEVFEQLKGAGLGSTPGTAAEVLIDSVREKISPNKLPASRWVQIIEAAHAAGIPSTSTVMFGHIESPAELAQHMDVILDLQQRSGGITEFVPLPFIPFQTLLGRTHGVREISRDENLKHTAVFRLALGDRIPNLQASWVKMGLDAATVALRWGVNDLGGTLMEESISNAAGSQHGSRLDPQDLIGAAHLAGRPAAQRDTLYGLIQDHPVPAAA